MFNFLKNETLYIIHCYSIFLHTKHNNTSKNIDHLYF